jgi:DNA-binding transcriptional regulator YdaS (Cro superfamily)
MGRKGPPPGTGGRPVELPGPLGILARAVGGTGRLAAELGVSSRTLQRWARKKGGLQTRFRAMLERVAAHHHLPPAVRRQLAAFQPERRSQRRRKPSSTHTAQRSQRALSLRDLPPIVLGRLPRPVVRTGGNRLRLPGALGALARAAGGTIHLARLLDVHTTTIQDWAKIRPHKHVCLLLARLGAEYGLSDHQQRELARGRFRRR